MSSLERSQLPQVPPPSAADLARLRHKYERLGELRAAVGQHSAEQVRTPLRELAKEFPGSLREIDVLSSERIQERVTALESGSEPPEWAEVIHGYHVLMRVSLWLKTQLSSREDAPRLAEEVEHRFQVICAPEWIGRVAKPPRGRLNDLVFEALTAQFGRSAADLRALIFPRGNTEPLLGDGAD
ncbi:MAG: hypothetical protein KC766_06355 [Myxococcales bacterium]|nr:hypothetical protein [Myxococcales bacterium]